MTLLEVLTSASNYLAERGVENPRLNAEHLFAHALGKRRLDLYLEFDRPLTEAMLTPLRALVRQRGLRLPLQHLLGTAEFFGRPFLCDSRALIPRPETEQLLDFALTHLRPLQPTFLLDSGTGSGVIAATLALELPEASIDATDISTAALTLATENLSYHKIIDRVYLQEADLFPSKKNRYHAILANLPYIPTPEIQALSPEVRSDPIQALDGGSDGLHLLRRLIVSAGDYLQPDGWIWLEIGCNQSEAVFLILAQNGFDEIRVLKDYQNVPRFIAAKK